MSSNNVILHFPVEFDALYTDKGYWPYAVVELPTGDHVPVYFAQIFSSDLPAGKPLLKRYSLEQSSPA